MAEELGVSDAIGAFMAGLILAESRGAHRIEQLVLPLRDTFAAMFFFAFGVTIDPSAVGRWRGPVAIAVVADRGAQRRGRRIIAARMYGLGPARLPPTSASPCSARGEFSLILAVVAAAAGLDDRIAPFVAGYVLILAFGGADRGEVRAVAGDVPFSRGRSNGPPARGGAPLPHP